MHSDKGLKRILKIPCVYQTFQNLLGARRMNTWYAENVWKVKKGDKVIDLGCGTGQVLEFLPNDIEFIGIDVNKNYIKNAKENYGEKASFFCGKTEDFINDGNFINADLIMATCLLHHLSDHEIINLLNFARKSLRPGGKFISYDPTYLLRQDRISKFILGKDRGRNMKSEQEWKEIFRKVFTKFNTSIVTSLFPIPYMHIILVYEKNE